MHRDPLPPLNRRHMLHRIGAGFGTLGLAGVMHEAGEGVQPNLQEAYARYYMAGTRGHRMAAQYAHGRF